VSATHRKSLSRNKPFQTVAKISSSILEKNGVDVIVDLPFVGENMQDQTTTDMSYSSVNGTYANGLAGYAAYFNVDDVMGEDLDSFNASVANSIKQYAEMTANASGVIDPSVTERLFRIQYDLIFKNKLPISEIIVAPGASGPVTIEYWGLLPFSRGNIHINSKNASAPATINPNYFMLDYDIRQQVATAKMARKFAETAPFSDSITGEITPGLDTVPENASNDDWARWLKSTCKFN
jgi:choline dehydrogenase-like flavoprotein